MSTKPAKDAPKWVQKGVQKGAKDENFPVGSILIPKALRPHVMCYYNFAREIDDVADNPASRAEEKVQRLKAFGHALTHGSDDPSLSSAARLHISMQETNIPFDHGLDLISAFKQDAVQSRYESWDDLIDYCQRSAAPVGRYLLDLHGEDRALYPASAALCHALQVINHLQDVAEDRRDMDRVYIPTDWLRLEGLDISELDAASTSPALRRVFDKMLGGTTELLEHSAKLAPAMTNRHLRAETRIIQKIAETLTKRLYNEDPIATRIELSKPAALLTAVKALIGV